MRVAIIGAGAVGGTIAALLARGGHEVTVTARGAHLRTILDDGLELTGVWGEYTARVAASDVLTRAPELAIVTTKAQDAEAAMRQNARFLDGVPVIVVQNGLDGLVTAKRVLPGADIVGGLALYAASYLSPGKVAVTTDGVTCIGGPVSGALYASKVLGAVMPVTLTDNFEGAQWTKLIVNHINALPAITGLSAQEVISHRGLRRIMTESMREAVRVGLARGIEFEKVQGLGDRMLRLLAALPAGVGQLVPLAMKARMGATPNPGSTQQSIRRGQATEIDYLNGAVVRAAVGTGVATPIEQALVAMVHEVELSGAFLDPAEVIARLG
jgi:2-dehydropantoate 2-reductase